MSQPGPVIGQMLHGYRDGHRMLAGSLRLESQADGRLVQILSDSADAARISPDRPLLSGYPLPSGAFYVLAMTWPAPEIHRPGCVWTHSLLLDDVALDLGDLGFLLHEFRRPSGEESWRDYSRPLRPRYRYPVEHGHARVPEVTSTVLWSIYEPPAPPVDVRVRSLEDLDPATFLLQCFSQLWPALRRRVSFAVAPRTARRIDGRLMDIMVTTEPQQSSWEQVDNEPPARHVSRPLARRPPAWCLALSNDWGTPGRLREFLREAEPLVPPARTSMYALASVWAAFDPAYPEAGYPALLTALTGAFPDPSEAAGLKNALFSGEMDGPFPFDVDSAAILAAIGTARLPEGFDLDALNLEERAADLARRSGSSAKEVAEKILEGRVQEQGLAILSGLGSGLSASDIQAWSKDEPALLAELASRSPSIAARDDLWRNVPLEALWPKLRRPRAARMRREAMLGAMLRAEARPAVKAALNDWEDGHLLLLDWMATQNGPRWDPELLGLLDSASVVRWLKQHGPEPVLAQAILETWKPKQIAKVPVVEWNALLESEGELNDHAAALLFVAASNPQTDLGPSRAIAAFRELYRRTASGGSLQKRAIRVLDDAAAVEASLSPRDLAGYLLARGFLHGKWNAALLLDLDERPLRTVIRQDRSGMLAESMMPALRDAKAPRPQRDVIFDALLSAEDHDVLARALRFLRGFVPWM